MFVPLGPLGQKQHSRGHNAAMPCTTAVPRPKPCEENKKSCVSRCSRLQDWICYEGLLSLSNNSVLVWPRHRLRYAGTRPFVQPSSSTGQWFVFLIFKLLSPVTAWTSDLLSCAPCACPASLSKCLSQACFLHLLGLLLWTSLWEPATRVLLFRAVLAASAVETVIPLLFVFCKFCFFRLGSDLLTCYMFFFRHLMLRPCEENKGLCTALFAFLVIMPAKLILMDQALCQTWRFGCVAHSYPCRLPRRSSHSIHLALQCRMFASATHTSPLRW